MAKYGAETKQTLKRQRPYTKEELRAMLPKVGDRRMECMTSTGGALGYSNSAPQPCTVVEVNEEHYWYRVVFDSIGASQCYKLPEVSWSGSRMGVI